MIIVILMEERFGKKDVFGYIIVDNLALILLIIH